MIRDREQCHIKQEGYALYQSNIDPDNENCCKYYFPHQLELLLEIE